MFCSRVVNGTERNEAKQKHATLKKVPKDFYNSTVIATIVGNVRRFEIIANATAFACGCLGTSCF